MPTAYLVTQSKAKRKRTSKNAKQMRNKKRNCFFIFFCVTRNDKQCVAKQCFANQTNRCSAGFASRSELFRYSTHGKQNTVETYYSGTPFVDKEKHRHWSLFRTCSDENIFFEFLKQRFAKQFFCFGVTQTINRGCAKPFCFVFLVF